jgi:hypothetical protein
LIPFYRAEKACTVKKLTKVLVVIRNNRRSQYFIPIYRVVKECSVKK